MLLIVSCTHQEVPQGSIPLANSHYGRAVRVIKSMPHWIAGRQNGSPVRVRYTLPVTFKLQ